MKRLSLIALLLITLTTGAVANEGWIGLYTDNSGTDCDATFVPFLSNTLSILYVKSDSGPNGITAAQFKLQVSTANLLIQEFFASPEVSATTGNIGVGILLEFPSCTGVDIGCLFLGSVTVLSLVNEIMTLRIVAAEDVVPEDPPVEVRVALCDEDRTKQAVFGFWFTTPNGTCHWPWDGTESKSWGAIKGLYQ